jgi:hypothetical protein
MLYPSGECSDHALMGFAKELENRDLFLGCHFEEVRHVTLRNRDDVTRTQ